MSTFNFGSIADINVGRNEDSVNIRFGPDTLVFNNTTNGVSVTNDWNNRHFTLAFEENSILYHLTREDLDDRGSGKKALSFEEFIAEMYGYLRAIAPAYPVDDQEFELVGKLDLEATREYLEEHEALRDTDSGLRFNSEKVAELEKKLEKDGKARGEVYQRILDPLTFEEAKESNEHIFVYPTMHSVFVLFFFPDDYIAIAPIQDVLEFASTAGGSQLVDHVLRSVSGE